VGRHAQDPPTHDDGHVEHFLGRDGDWSLFAREGERTLADPVTAGGDHDILGSLAAGAQVNLDVVPTGERIVMRPGEGHAVQVEKAVRRRRGRRSGS
jgi:hypothetical protein